MKQVVAHPDRAEMQVLASPIKVDGARLPGRAAPLLGADSDAILGDLGYDAAEIDRLRANGAV
jgi:crotonobetainyl-CoA:carnitine CoA-transferase CaiB-like acyl-CoA transferase